MEIGNSVPLSADFSVWNNYLTFQPIFDDNDLKNLAGITVSKLDKNKKPVSFLNPVKRCTIRLWASSTKISNQLTGKLFYRLNTKNAFGEWKQYKFNTQIDVAKGSSIQWWNKWELAGASGAARLSIDINNYVKFVFDYGHFACSGSIQSLLNFKTTVTSYSFNRLFYGCANLCSAPELPASDIQTGCYYQMFFNCTKLFYPPKMSENILVAPADCFFSMFEGCTSLVETPYLSARTLGTRCYKQMFKNCKTLVNPMTNLPATSLGNSCYMGMFQFCEGITKMPRIAVNDAGLNNIKYLPPYCFKSMFDGCVNMTYADQFLTQNMNLGTECCCNMFHNCVKLYDGTFNKIYCVNRSFKEDASHHPNHTSAYSFKYMFQGCKALTEIHFFIKGFYRRTVNGAPAGVNEVCCNWLDGTKYGGWVDNQAKLFEKDFRWRGEKSI